MKRGKIFSNIDWILLSIYIILVFIGWSTIYSASYEGEHIGVFNFSTSYGKQLIWIIISIILAFGIMLFDSKIITSFSYLYYGITVLLLILVLFIGQKVAGSQSWFAIGSFKIQPAELAKFATVLALAKFLSGINVSLKTTKNKTIALSIIILPALLILIQGDTGSALVYFSLMIVLYRMGWPQYQLILIILLGFIAIAALLVKKIILISIIGGLCILTIYILRKAKKTLILFTIMVAIFASALTFSIDYVFNNILRPHQKSRINVLIGKDKDLHGAGYNVNQSKIAIGSGGLSGKGYLKGTQTKFNFVPEQRTDFIFCTIGEEFGFIGSSLLILLFLALLIRIIIISERQKIKYSKIYGYGVASIFLFHLIINIGMTIGLAPIIGIPLPFISYGGSSLMGFTILLFILIKLDAERKDVL